MKTKTTVRGLVLGIGAAALISGAAVAADVPVKVRPVAPAATPTWDIAFGGIVMSDYNFRGVSQSNRGPSAGAYFEPQFVTSFGTLYLGLAGYGVNWPSAPAFGFTDPSAEIDFTAGWRNTWGMFSLDLGFIYYYYPREIFNGFTNNSDFWEVYAKLGFAITPDLSIGANIFYTPDLLHYSQSFAVIGVPGNASAVYASLTGKWVLPWKSGDLGAYVSGELGHWWIGGPFVANGFLDPDYTYFNLGLAFTYKALTLDLRWHGTDMSLARCGSFLLVGPANPAARWCGDTFIVALKFDTTLNALK
jgi:uncharacterized protein (TIGR02001 family)